MKFVLGVCLIAAGMTGMVVAQDPTKPVLRQGISVEMPAGKRSRCDACSRRSRRYSDYADSGRRAFSWFATRQDRCTRARACINRVREGGCEAPYEQVLTVLDALHDHSIVLLTAPTAKTVSGKASPPYGVRLAMGGKESD